MVQDALARRADSALLQPGTKRVDLVSQYCHEPFRNRRVAPEGRQQLALRVNPHAGGDGGDRVAVVGGREERRLGEELTLARRVQHDRMAVDRVADQSQSPLLDLEYCRCLVALAKEDLARVERADGRALSNRHRKPIERGHRHQLSVDSSLTAAIASAACISYEPPPTLKATLRASSISVGIARSSTRIHNRPSQASQWRATPSAHNQLLVVHSRRCGPTTLTTTSFCTVDTPGADHAAVSACFFSSQERTLPRKITLLSIASTLI